MDLKKTTKILKKINRLYDIISDIGEASTTETDLLKAYIKELYDSVYEGEGKIPVSPAPVQKKETVKPAAIPEPVEETLDVPVATAPVEQQAKAASSSEGFSEQMEELFDVSEISELSDKLSSAPIKDLSKAMGINEKIFTVKELFGGDQSEFDNMMTALNGAKGYEEARSILMRSVASKYDWDAPAKLKKAKTFIKLVQRRYK